MFGYVLCLMAGAAVGVLLTCVVVSGQSRMPEPTPEDMTRHSGLWV